VTLDAEELPAFAKEHDVRTGTDVTTDPAVHDAVQRAIDRANAAVSHAESIKTFRILPDDFTVERGELTQSMKVRRPQVLENHADVIDEIYRR
jgi:long-chain acyl-CoA synthetase